MKLIASSILVSSFSFSATAGAGPYADAGIPATSSSFVGFATTASLTRGPQNVGVAGSPPASFGVASDAIGASDGVNIVSLGDGGSATLGFARPIRNGPGADFAVFENGFAVGARLFAELAFVEVSSDGATFVRFPAVSLTPTAAPLGTYGTIDPTDVSNLAGKHPANVGTGFDLAQLAGVAGLNVNAITTVRIVDVVGTLDGLGTSDAVGHKVNDPFPTPFPTGGFDLDAVGVIHVATTRTLRDPQSQRRLGGESVDALHVVVPEPALAPIAFVSGALLRRRRWTSTVAAMFTCALTLGGSIASARVTVNFDDRPLPLNTYDNGGPVDGPHTFASGGATLNNTYFASFGGFAGFALSNVVDSSTPGFGNQYARYTPADVTPLNTYAVGFLDSFDGIAPTIDLPAGTRPTSIGVANTTYVALSLRDGDAFAKKFGGASGLDPDYFSVTFTGYSGAGGTGATTGATTFYLADYRPAGTANDYIVSAFTTISLAGLGSPRSIELSFDSSDVGAFGINTPLYAIIDDLTLVPEPATLAVLVGLPLLDRRRR